MSETYKDHGHPPGWENEHDPRCQACALSELASSGGSPIRATYSRKEIALKMRAWMSVEFGEPGDYINEPDQREKWYRDYGMLYHFICDHFPAENVKDQ